MSRPAPALILPISDLDLARDTNTKLRLAGVVTAICPYNASLVALTDFNPAEGYEAVSVLVDLSLCAQHNDADSYTFTGSRNGGDAGGWKSYRQELRAGGAIAKGKGKALGVAPPELKSEVMVLGHLTKRDLPLDITWLTEKGAQKVPLIEPQVRHAIPGLTPTSKKGDVEEENPLLPNRYFVLEALLFKPLDANFDLALWNYSARLRSQNEWHHHHNQLGPKRDKGKRKAID